MCCSMGARSVWLRSRARPGSSTNTPQCEMKFSVAATCASLQMKRPRRWGVTSPSSTSRPAEPDASRYPASARIESSFACLESRHRAPLVAEEELGMHEGAGCRRTPRSIAYRKGCGRSPFQTRLGVRPRLHGRLEFETRRARTSLIVRTPGQ